MISVDTNLVVRLLTRDDELQYKKRGRFSKSNSCFLPTQSFRRSNGYCELPTNSLLRTFAMLSPGYLA